MRKICVAVCAAIISIMGIVAFSNVATGTGTGMEDTDLDAAFESIQQRHQEWEAASNRISTAMRNSPVCVWAVNQRDIKYTADELSSLAPSYDYILANPDLTKEEIVSAIEKQKEMVEAGEALKDAIAWRRNAVIELVKVIDFQLSAITAE